MDTVALKYGTDIVIHACDAAWTADSANAATADTSDKMEGTGSAQIALTGGQDTTLWAHKSITSADYSTKLALQMWIKSSVELQAGQVSMLLSATSNCSSPIEVLSVPHVWASKWTLVLLPLATPASDTAIVAVGIKGTLTGSATIHIDNVLAVSGRSFSTFGVRGFSAPDDIGVWPGLNQVLLDGSIRQVITRFRRQILFTIVPNSMTTVDVAWMVTSFLPSMTWRMVYLNEDIAVVFTDLSATIKSTWLSDTEIARAYPMNLLEKTARSTAPLSWSY
jgi:hypothetical protein